MRKKIITAIAVAGVSVVSFAGAADAAPGKADGTCVAKGVQNLDGPTIAAAATGKVVPGVNAVPIVIKDHVFNKAQGPGSITEAVC